MDILLQWAQQIGPKGVSIDDGKIDKDNLTFKLNFDDEIIPPTGKYYKDPVAMDIILNDKQMHFAYRKQNRTFSFDGLF